MKRLLLFAAAAAFVACGQGPAGKTAADRPQDDCVEVLCFHGAKRCATCIAIETGVKEVLETDFAGQVGKETVTDLTSFAFANARTNPEQFKAELCAEIRKQLGE